MNAPKINFIQPIWGAMFLTLMFITAYGGDWIGAAGWLFLGWADSYLTGEKEKALPRESYLTNLYDGYY